MFDYEDPLSHPRTVPFLCDSFCQSYVTDCDAAIANCSDYTTVQFHSVESVVPFYLLSSLPFWPFKPTFVLVDFFTVLY
jgi:hypothetical protein